MTRLDRERCRQLLRSRSTNEAIASPFRCQLKAALAELDRMRAELERVTRDNQRLAPAADALLHETRAHSSACVCPMCRSLRGVREQIRARVAEYRAKAGDV